MLLPAMPIDIPIAHLVEQVHNPKAGIFSPTFSLKGLQTLLWNVALTLGQDV